MDPVVVALLQSWTLEPWLITVLMITSVIYGRGWWWLHHRRPQRFGIWELLAFQAGLLALFLALASPLDALAELLLQVHMIQHLMLMMVVPPLLWLGAPVLPLLHGLPQPVVKCAVGPVLASPPLQRFGHSLTHPLVCWFAFAVSTIVWHVPNFYELALRSAGWHEIQHLCFLGTGLLFWWPVIQPWPSQSHWPRWTMIFYLLLADLQNTALSAVLMFSERILYPTYATVPRLWNLSVLDDQAAAGVLMWVPGSVIFLVPLGVLVVRFLDAPRIRRAAVCSAALLLMGVRPAWGHHGGDVRLMEKAGPFLITVFSDPTPLRVGPVDFSVLVQDGDSGRPILDAEVTVRIREHGTGGPSILTQATRQNATNKLLYAAPVNLPAPGLWELQVSTRRQAQAADVMCMVTAAPPGFMPRAWLLYAALLSVMIGGGALHQWRRWQRGELLGGSKSTKPYTSGEACMGEEDRQQRHSAELQRSCEHAFGSYPGQAG
jgi:cytochrome c oxidase assembly factor CtaG